MTSIVLRSGGMEVPYTVVSGQFDITDAKLDIALELEIGVDDNDEAPRELMIRFANLRFGGDKRLHIRDHHDQWGADDGEPHAYVYTGFHHTDISAWIDVESHDDDELVATIKVITGDVDRYDEQAKNDSILGKCILARGSRNDLWHP